MGVPMYNAKTTTSPGSLLTLEDIVQIKQTIPISIFSRSAAGRLERCIASVHGERASRRLSVLSGIASEDARLLVLHPMYLCWVIPGPNTLLILTSAGHAGRLTTDGEQQRAILDDGQGRVVKTFMNSSVGSVIEVAARFLHAEYTGEATCRGCGCTDSWGCEYGCTWAEPGLCDACQSESVP